jgi:hypothetical protein
MDREMGVDFLEAYRLRCDELELYPYYLFYTTKTDLVQSLLPLLLLLLLSLSKHPYHPRPVLNIDIGLRAIDASTSSLSAAMALGSWACE